MVSDLNILAAIITAAIWGLAITRAIYDSADKITKAIEQLGKDKP